MITAIQVWNNNRKAPFSPYKPYPVPAKNVEWESCAPEEEVILTSRQDPFYKFWAYACPLEAKPDA